EAGRVAERESQAGKRKPEVDYVEAEHDPVASRRASDAAIRRMFGAGRSKLDNAAQSVAVTVPEAKARSRSAHVANDRVPTVDEVFDPQRPALDGATNAVVMGRIHDLVKVM